uniref:Putative ribonuclease H-like domain-containing protein n=1 Tax=Tanacetum cinerariifolium TaxID=118510 RepID=A0A6L2LC45_TANCI|nr:putative ribonuclease H-like domain-containing protein [Tanacetum cinerariifolium]
MVAILEKSNAAGGFDQIIDFLTVVKRSGDVTRLQALVDKKRSVITDEVVREILQLNDAEGVICLPNDEIFVGLARIGYEKPSTKLTFYKEFFSTQWKFFIHMILHSLSAKRTSWNEFSSAMASALICLSSGQRFNFSKYIFDSLVRNVDSSSKFYMVRKGFSGVETPLFETMLAVRDIAEEAEDQVPGQGDDVHEHAAEEIATDVVPPTPTSPSPTSPVLDICSTLFLRVKGLENANVAQQLEIVKLKARVKKLEKLNKVKSSKLRRLKKVCTSQRVESSDDVENVFNQGRIRIELVVNHGKDAEVEGRHADKQAEIYNIDLDHSSKVLSMQEVDTEVQEAVEVVTTAKLITEVVTAAATQVVAANPEEELHTDTPAETPIMKDKGKGILIEDPKPMKKKDHVEMDVETLKATRWNSLRERHMIKFFQSFKSAIPLAQKVPVVDYQVVVIDNKPKYKIIRADDTHQFYISFTTLLKNFDREDLETLWKISNVDAARLKLKVVQDAAVVAHAKDLKNTVLEKDLKISELEECVRNKDLEIEKCLERLNVCENKLHKIGQTNQTVHMIMPSNNNLYNGQKGIGFKNPSYFEKAKDLRQTLYDEKVIGLGYTMIFLTHSDEALEIEKFKRSRENKIEFAYDYGNLNASFESSENVISKLENQSENDYLEIEKECDKEENPKHMTGNRALLMNFMEKFLGTVRFGNNDFAMIAGYGDVVIGSMTIKKVYYVKGLGHNLFSIRQFCDKGLEVAFQKSTCFVRNEDGIDLLIGDCSSNLYTIALNEVASNSSTCLLAKASSLQSWLWHQRLSHLNLATINNLVKNNLVQGLPKMKFEKDHLCSACEQGKNHRKHHKSKMAFALNKPLYLLHMDLCGPMHVQSINGKRYVLVVVDDYSRYTWLFFLHSKDEASEVIISFIKKILVNLQLQVQRVRTDNGTEFKNKTLAKFFDERVRTDNGTEFKNKTLAKFFDEVGITQQFSATRTPQQNSVVERRNRTLVEAVRTMLTFANLPSFLWAEAIATACFTQNHLIIHKRFDKTPYELMNKRKPNIKFFRVFGCRCYLLNDYEMLVSSRQRGILECLLDIQKNLLLSEFTTNKIVKFMRA